MTSQNSFLLYQLVHVLKWWYMCISLDISVEGFQTIMVYVYAWCLHVINWRHDVTKITTWRQETSCLHLSLQMCSSADFIFVSVISLMAELNLIIVVVFPWWNNVTKWRHAVLISACRRAREMILYFVSVVIWVAKFKNIIDFVFSYVVMSQRDAITSWHDYMTSQNSFHLYQLVGWLDRWFDLCPCIHGCLDYSIIKCRCLIRKCHSISTGMMTLLCAVTSWSWRISTI